MRGYVIALVLLVLSAGTVCAQSVASHIRGGNRAYRKSQFKDAELEYYKALYGDQGSVKATFNLGDAQYEQGRYEEARKQYETLLSRGEVDKQIAADALYNIGNTHFREDKLQEALSAYKEALRIDPGHARAKYNLSETLRRLHQQQQEQQQQQQNQQGQQDKKDDSGDGQQKDQKDGQDKQQDDGKENSQDNKPDESGQQQESSPQQQQGGKMTQQEAAQLLKALENKEKGVQSDLQKKKEKGKVNHAKREKDW